MFFMLWLWQCVADALGAVARVAAQPVYRRMRRDLRVLSIASFFGVVLACVLHWRHAPSLVCAWITCTAVLIWLDLEVWSHELRPVDGHPATLARGFRTSCRGGSVCADHAQWVLAVNGSHRIRELFGHLS